MNNPPDKIFSKLLTLAYTFCLFTLVASAVTIIHSPYLQFNFSIFSLLPISWSIYIFITTLSIIATSIVHFRPRNAFWTSVVALGLFLSWPIFIGGPRALGDYIFFGLLQLKNQIAVSIFSTVIFSLFVRWLKDKKSKWLILILFLVIAMASVTAPFIFATKISNLSECTGTTDQVKFCQLDVAKKTNNLDLCVQASDASFNVGGLSAYAILKSSNIGTFYLDCVNSVWTNIGDSQNQTSCDTFADPRSKDICRYKYASKNKSSDLCGQISDSNLKDSCFNEISSSRDGGTVTSNSCANIKDIDLGQKCYANAAIQAKDVSLCQKVPFPPDAKSLQPYAIAECISNVATKISDSSMCDKIGSEDTELFRMKQTCTAKIQNSSTPCSMIKENIGKSLCQEQAAIYNKNLSICDVNDNKWGCYSEVAVVKNDKSICNLIPVDNIKRGCDASFR